MSTLSTPRELQPMSVREYLDHEARGGPDRFEFDHGELIAMAGATENHVLANVNVVSVLRDVLRDRPCRVYNQDMKVQVERSGRFVYPDATIACEPVQFREDEAKRLTITNPRVIFEISSESTATRDQTVKFRGYIAVPSIEEIFLIESDEPFVRSFLRQADGTWSFQVWHGLDAVARVRSLEIDLPLREIYLDVKFPPPEEDEGDGAG
jgi:Uma2 family endonuclease